MTELKYIRTDRNGTKYFEDWTCPRCGGAGASDNWWRTGRTCYACGGSGKRDKPTIHKEYTEAHAAKLESKRNAAAVKKLAEKMAANPPQPIPVAPVIEKPASEWLFEAGDKIEIEVTFKHAPSFVSRFGVAYIYTFEDPNGNQLVWKTSTYKPITDDAKLRIAGTVKEHNEYNGAKQTVLTRVKTL